MSTASFIWRTSEGINIPIFKMSTDHLINTLRYISRLHEPLPPRLIEARKAMQTELDKRENSLKQAKPIKTPDLASIL